MKKTDRDAVIDAALTLFRMNGYHNTSMADISASCGLLKGSIYHYFPGKKELAVAALDRVIAETREKLFRPALDSSVPAEVRLANLAERVERYFIGREGGCVMGNLALEVGDAIPEFQERVRTYFNDWNDALATLSRTCAPIVGCAFPGGEQGFNMARLVVLLADLPTSVGGTTMNRFCGSSMQRDPLWRPADPDGRGRLFVCAGVESMSRVPMGGLQPAAQSRTGEVQPAAYIAMGETAENVARSTRSPASAGAFAGSPARKRAGRARPASSRTRSCRSDRRPDGRARTASAPRPPPRRSPAQAGLRRRGHRDRGHLLAADRRRLGGAGVQRGVRQGQRPRRCWRRSGRRRHRLRAGDHGHRPGGSDPQKALKRAGLAEGHRHRRTERGIRRQALACIEELGLEEAKTNPDGGADRPRPPARRDRRADHRQGGLLLKREGARYALATQCIGGGQGIATILEAAE
jgi:acetyl-CoA acyltransferase